MANRPVVFGRPGPYGGGGGSIADIYLQAGQNEADLRMQQGAILGNAVANVGQTAANAIMQHAEQKEKGKRDGALQGALTSWDGKDPRALFNSLTMVNPEQRMALTQGMVAIGKLGQGNEKEERENFGQAVMGVAALPSFESFAANYGTIREKLGAGAKNYFGIDLPEQPTEEVYRTAQQWARNAGAKAVPTREIRTRNADGSEKIDIVEDRPGFTSTSAAPPTKPPELGSAADHLTRWARERGKTPQELTAAEVEQARKAYGQADDRIIIDREPRVGLTANAKATEIERLSNSWNKIAQPVRSIRQAVNVIETGIERAKAGDMNAGQQAVLVAFQKILDPESVVREGEFARSAQGQSLFNRIAGALTKHGQGGVGMTNAELQQYASMARDVLNGYQKDVAAARKRIGSVAKEFDIKEEQVFTDYDLFGGADSGGGEVQIKNEADYNAVPSGAYYIDPKGVRRRKP